MGIKEQYSMMGETKNIPTEDWRSVKGFSYGAFATSAKSVMVINDPIQIYDQSDLINSIQKLELTMAELNDKLNIIIANSAKLSSSQEEITLKDVPIKDAIREIKAYLKDNDSEITISELMKSLLIKPSIISDAVDELIKCGDIKEI